MASAIGHVVVHSIGARPPDCGEVVVSVCVTVAAWFRVVTVYADGHVVALDPFLVLLALANSGALLCPSLFVVQTSVAEWRSQ